MQLNDNIIKYRYGFVLVLIVLSFFITYAQLEVNKNSNYTAKTVHDNLSGEDYNTAGIYNYKDTNPYGSYFVGFDQITNRGMRNSEWIYISDVLTNFTMYNQKTYNGKISYVKNSFVREDKKNSFDVYDFKFAINDGKFYTMRVQSSWVQEIIRTSIKDTSNKEVFFKEFKVYS